MADPSLPSDPDDFMALMTVTVAMQRGVQVTKNLIMETTLAFLTDGNPQQVAAAQAFKFDRTTAAAIRIWRRRTMSR